MSQITTHILDVSTGRPAAGVEVGLQVEGGDGQWNVIGRGLTDDDGRQKELMNEADLQSGNYRLTFAVGGYFKRSQRPCFYENVEITFKVEDASEHYHVPLLLSPFGYSTYRGS